ncbi:transmembrane protein 268 [Burkholderia pseudomallei]|uniref:transmembrane protein 268 n=1 Tax=Burkholderia pseudomallei TaxID=28450 RepID=UPI000A42511F|nr:transmembrane protein 268 [Burkholderia pseudomallei]
MLIAFAIVIAAVVWASLHYSGEWFFSVATLIALALLVIQNQKLKKRLKDLGDGGGRRK